MLNAAPPVGQLAAEAGTTEHQVRLALYLRGLAGEQRTLAQACAALGRSKPTVQRLARAWLIDLADYRPYARRDPRPAPKGRLA